jgi:hypothetical protein
MLARPVLVAVVVLDLVLADLAAPAARLLLDLVEGAREALLLLLELAVLLLAVAVLELLLLRPSYSAAMARTTRCPAPAPTYEPVPRSR